MTGRVPTEPGSRASEWRRVPISPYRAYEVSSGGEIRRNGRALKGVHDSDGYLTVKLYYAGLSRRFKLHRLVCEAFHGAPTAPHLQAAHQDGNKLNNAAHNLRWMTPKDNSIQKQMHGTQCRKLTTAQVAEIRASLLGNNVALGRQYGVSECTVRDIKTGRRRANG